MANSIRHIVGTATGMLIIFRRRCLLDEVAVSTQEAAWDLTIILVGTKKPRWDIPDGYS